MNVKFTVVVIAALAVLFALSGCGEAKTQKPSAAAPLPANAAALPDGLLLKEAPVGAKNVGELKKTAKEGEEVIVRGQVGGREEVFTPDRAAFLIADMKLPACSMRPGDKCETPWDFCCETKETRAENTATIQVVDSAGKLLKANLRGVNGIDHLSVVVIKGTVAKREEQNLVINASGIFVEKAAAVKAAAQ